MIDRVKLYLFTPVHFENQIPDTWQKKFTKEHGWIRRYKGVHMQFFFSAFRGLWIDFNAPKVLFGNNSILLDMNSVQKALDIVYHELYRQVKYILPPLTEWRVSWIEYPIHYACVPGEVGKWIEVLKNGKQPHMKTLRQYDGTVYYRNGSREVCGYIKLPDVLRVEYRFKKADSLKTQLKLVYGDHAQNNLSWCLGAHWIRHINTTLHLACRTVTGSEAKYVMESAEWSRTKIKGRMDFLNDVAKHGAQHLYDAQPQKFSRKKSDLEALGIPLLLVSGLHDLVPILPMSTAA